MIYTHYTLKKALFVDKMTKNNNNKMSLVVISEFLSDDDEKTLGKIYIGIANGHS